MKKGNFNIRDHEISNRIYKFNNDINIYFISDLHIGHVNCNYKLIKEILARLEKDPLGIAIFNGDMLETVTPYCQLPTKDQDIEIDDQVDYFINLLKNKKLNDKTLFIRPGNHEMRIAKAAGLNICHRISEETGIKEESMGGSLHRIIIKNKTYNIMTTHGCGGAASTIFKKMYTWKKGCDVYLMGHNHVLSCQNIPIQDQHVKFENNDSFKDCYWIQAGCFLGHASYAHDINMPPSVNGCMVLTFTEKTIKTEKIV